jgi:hypothetical protein
MNMINLLGNMGPSQDEPEEIEEAQDKEEKTEPEIRTITWCGCGNHPINPKKDPYKQHNIWMAQFHPHDESGRSDIRRVKGIGASKSRPKPTYDFSGEEFEVTNDILRKHKK